MERPILIGGRPSNLVLRDTNNIGKIGCHDVLVASSKVCHGWTRGMVFRLSLELEPYVTFDGIFTLLEDERRITDHMGASEYRYNFAGELCAIPAKPKETPKRPPLDRWKLVV